MVREMELEVGEATGKRAMPQVSLAVGTRRGWRGSWRSGRPPASGQCHRCRSPSGRGGHRRAAKAVTLVLLQTGWSDGGKTWCSHQRLRQQIPPRHFYVRCWVTPVGIDDFSNATHFTVRNQNMSMCYVFGLVRLMAALGCHMLPSHGLLFFFPNSGSNAGYRPVELVACPTSNGIDCPGRSVPITVPPDDDWIGRYLCDEFL